MPDLSPYYAKTEVFDVKLFLRRVANGDHYTKGITKLEETVKVCYNPEAINEVMAMFREHLQ